jgi:hypothetical protein
MGPVIGVCEVPAFVVGTTVAAVDDGGLVGVTVVVVACDAAFRERDGEFDKDQAALTTVRTVNMPKAAHEPHRPTAIDQEYAGPVAS